MFSFVLQLPILGYQLRILPVIISASVGILASQMYFSIIFMQGGVGKNGSTVAVSTRIYRISGSDIWCVWILDLDIILQKFRSTILALCNITIVCFMLTY